MCRISSVSDNQRVTTDTTGKQGRVMQGLDHTSHIRSVRSSFKRDEHDRKQAVDVS